MKFIRISILLLGILVSLNSCTREELVDNIPEGEPAVINLRVNVTHMGSATRMSLPEETKIGNIRVMIFDKAGSVINNQKYDEYPLGGITLTTTSGANHSIRVVANFSAAMGTKLDKISTLSDLNTTIDSYTSSDELNNGKALLMIGTVDNANIPSGKEQSIKQINVPMTFMVAKLVLTVKDGTQDPKDEKWDGPVSGAKVSFLGYEIIDMPKNSYLFSNLTDANAGKETDAKAWYSSPEIVPFDVSADKTTISKTLYLLENRRGGRVPNNTGTNPPNGPSGKPLEANEPGDKKFFSPKRSTYIKIHARYESPDKDQILYIYACLGANGTNDYNVERGNVYTFNVKVRGIGSVNVDGGAEVPEQDSKFNITIGHLSLDTHADSRAIYLSTAKEGTAIVEIMDEANKTIADEGFSAKWLTVSPVPTGFQVRTKSVEKYQQHGFTGDGNILRPMYPTREEGVVTKKYVDTKIYKDATYKRYYSITEIPVKAMGPSILYLYAEEYNVDAATNGNRRASVRVTFTPTDKNSAVVRRKYQLNQCGYQAVFNENGGLNILDKSQFPTQPPMDKYKKFVVEQIEEARIRIYPSEIRPESPSETMQWGFYDKDIYKDGYKYRDGNMATALAVFSNYKRGIYPGTDLGEPFVYDGEIPNYREKYGQGRGYSGTITEIGLVPVSSSPYYLLDYKMYDRIYNISAARYCFEKNYDTNENGEIDANEMLWYLPSLQELQLILLNNFEEEKPEVGLIIDSEVHFPHWSSTTGTYDITSTDLKQAYTVEFATGVTTSVDRTEQNYVRCVRKWTN